MHSLVEGQRLGPIGHKVGAPTENLVANPDAGAVASRAVRVGLLAHVGTTNLGDEAILEATIGAVRNWTPRAELFVVSINPSETSLRHGIAAFPLRRTATRHAIQMSGDTAATTVSDPVRFPTARWARALRSVPGAQLAGRALRAAIILCRTLAGEAAFLIQSWRRLRGTRLLIVAGGNQLGDWFGGPWGFPYTLFKWCALGRAVGAKVAFMGVGAGPLDEWLSVRFCTLALRFGAYVGFRDGESQRLMQACGFRGTSSVVPDLAFGLTPMRPNRAYGSDRGRVVLNVFPYKDPAYDPHVHARGSEFLHYIAMMAEIAEGLAARGHEIIFACSQRADRSVVDAVIQRLGDNPTSSAPVLEPRTSSELRAILASADFVVASRFHGILFSILAARPVIGLSYQSKSMQLMQSVGMGRFALAIAETTSSEVLARFEELRTQAEACSEEIWARALANHQACAEQFDFAATLAGLNGRDLGAEAGNARRPRASH